MRGDLIKTDGNDGEVEREVYRYQKHRDPDSFLETTQKDCAQRGDQQQRYKDSMMQEMQVIEDERVFDDVCSRVSR